MARKNPSGEHCTLVYPKHALSPEDLLNFIETKVFARAWKDLGLSDDDLFVLQIAMMGDPKGPPVIPGTGGLRKLRFSPPEWRRGKRGALRVCYVYFEEYAIILLVIAYAKGEKDALSAREKRTIRDLIEQQEKELAKGPVG
jgi:hypothetical protein